MKEQAGRGRRRSTVIFVNRNTGNKEQRTTQKTRKQGELEARDIQKSR